MVHSRQQRWHNWRLLYLLPYPHLKTENILDLTFIECTLLGYFWTVVKSVSSKLSILVASRLLPSTILSNKSKNSFTLSVLNPCALAKDAVCDCLSLSCGCRLLDPQQAYCFLPEISCSLLNLWEKWLSSAIWIARRSKSLMITPNMRGSNCRKRITNSSSKCGGISPRYQSVECFPLHNNSSYLNVFTGQLWQKDFLRDAPFNPTSKFRTSTRTHFIS